MLPNCRLYLKQCQRHLCQMRCRQLFRRSMHHRRRRQNKVSHMFQCYRLLFLDLAKLMACCLRLQSFLRLLKQHHHPTHQRFRCQHQTVCHHHRHPQM